MRGYHGSKISQFLSQDRSRQSRKSSHYVYREKDCSKTRQRYSVDLAKPVGQDELRHETSSKRVNRVEERQLRNVSPSFRTNITKTNFSRSSLLSLNVSYLTIDSEQQ